MNKETAYEAYLDTLSEQEIHDEMEVIRMAVYDTIVPNRIRQMLDKRYIILGRKMELVKIKNGTRC
jgi:predicted DNA-binding protein YlxM (UPF0122 family)